jgi:PilZ domain
MSHAIVQPPLFDARREPRYSVHWRGRVQLPGRRVIELRLKDISESGMGLITSEAVPSGATLAIAVRVPDPGGSAQTSEVTGTVQTAYVALRGYDFNVGVIWVERDDAGRELMSRWIARLRYSL